MTSVPDFETICKHKDSNSSNLNEKFASYGCSTLEAKVPVVDRSVVEEVQTAESSMRTLATLALKSESASMAMKGRAPRTRHRELRVVEVDGEVMLEAGAERDRSPVDRGELDDELELYARERARIKAKRMGIEMPKEEVVTEPRSLQPRAKQARSREAEKENGEENWDDEPKQEVDLDDDIDSYMREAARKRAQKRQLAEQTDRMDLMMRMEDEDL